MGEKTTVGISPKVKAAIGALSVPGIVVLIVALATKDNTLLTIALSLLGATVPVGGAAYQAKPGEVSTEKITPVRVVPDTDR